MNFIILILINNFVCIYRFKDKIKKLYIFLNKRIFNEKKKKNVLLYLYQYANLAGGLMLSLFLRLRSKDELSHMHFPFRLLMAFPNCLI